MGSAFLYGQTDLLPSGAILLWSGAIANIPTGWKLCDGANGTPNLVNKFVVCAGGTYAVGATGGQTSQTVNNHTHSYSGTTNYSGESTRTYATPGNYTPALNHYHSYSGTTAAGGGFTVNSLPPYYSLCYIMKL
jgi:hypothetical protein